MAFTKTPIQSSAETKMIPLMYEFETRSRDDAKDTDALNVIWEPVQNQTTGDNYFNALKRDGSTQILANTPDNQKVLGLFYWNLNGGYLIVVTNGHIYVYISNTMQLTATFNFLSFLPQVGGTEFLYQNGTRSFCIFNGTTLVEISSALAFTPCIDPDIPGGNMIDIEYLDGYLFIAKPDGTIANSDLNNPQSWSPSNFIKADAYGDQLVSLKRSGNYLVALGAQSTQYYYDAGNPTGTPLAAMTGSTLSIGCVGAVAKKENALYFVGMSSAGIYRVYKLENFKATEVGTPAINRWLTTTTVVYNNNGLFLHGHMLMLNGHTVYTISQEPSDVNQFTYGLDLDTNLWSRFTFPTDTTVITSACTGNMALMSPQQNTQRTVYSTTNSNGRLLQFEPNTGTDVGGFYQVTFRTPQQDFGTYRNKFGSRLVLWADKPAATSVCQVSWTDDDYQTFSTPRNLELFQNRPALYALGSFNRRSFKVGYNDFYPMRWKYLELDYDQGTA